ncbi:hypothetical protein MUK42_19379 [Musa troglodytarum]|uniref:Uncharacterized protein n=1 Tax=Musa troglodytarum TaxID=320322 RepID=A0A9E7FU55_9LILI|nr:hypothetical protein MUK42_19379 [Musa troglodytarum]
MRSFFSPTPPAVSSERPAMVADVSSLGTLGTAAAYDAVESQLSTMAIAAMGWMKASRGVFLSYILSKGREADCKVRNGGLTDSISLLGSERSVAVDKPFCGHSKCVELVPHSLYFLLKRNNLPCSSGCCISLSDGIFTHNLHLCWLIDRNQNSDNHLRRIEAKVLFEEICIKCVTTETDGEDGVDRLQTLLGRPLRCILTKSPIIERGRYKLAGIPTPTTDTNSPSPVSLHKYFESKWRRLLRDLLRRPIAAAPPWISSR